MAGQRRRFTPEFELEAVRLARESERPLSQVVLDSGIRLDMLRAGKREAERRGRLTFGDVFPGNGNLSSQEEEVWRYAGNWKR